jgi:TolB protein
VGSAHTKKTVLAIPTIRTSTPIASALAKSMAETVLNDLAYMDIFKFLSQDAFLEDPKVAGIIPESFEFKNWSSIGADVLLKTALTLEIDQTLTLEAHLYETQSKKQVLAKKYFAPQSESLVLAHTLANDVVHTLTGLPGIFLTKIAMCCDRTGKKEIYSMNFDGSEPKQITHHRSLAFAPAWSPDSTKIAYSLFTRHPDHIKNIDLYEFNFTDSTVRLLSKRRGMNSGAAYSPDGRKIALTMSYTGNPEIFLLDPDTNALQKLTHSFGFDVDPSWSPKGESIAFVSSRTGVPMVFTMKADGSQTQRLTYAGRYNATPTWSPTGNKIGFAGWIDKSFDIFIMNPDGTNIERLTKNQGNNEDPYFSPDGNFVVFSSNRTGQKNIYVMNIDGTFVKRLTYGLGNCVAPKWSNPPISKMTPPASSSAHAQ